MGLEPTVYLYKPEITPDDEDPYGNPEITEHVTIMGAIKQIVDYNWRCEYLIQIKIKGELE